MIENQNMINLPDLLIDDVSGIFKYNVLFQRTLYDKGFIHPPKSKIVLIY